MDEIDHCDRGDGFSVNNMQFLRKRDRIFPSIDGARDYFGFFVSKTIGLFRETVYARHARAVTARDNISAM